MATGKKAYNFITRRLMNWSDGEGTEDRIERDGPALRATLLDHPRVSAVALCTYALPAKGVGLYAFVETDLRAVAHAIVFTRFTRDVANLENTRKKRTRVRALTTTCVLGSARTHTHASSRISGLRGERYPVRKPPGAASWRLSAHPPPTPTPPPSCLTQNDKPELTLQATRPGHSQV